MTPGVWQKLWEGEGSHLAVCSAKTDDDHTRSDLIRTTALVVLGRSNDEMSDEGNQVTCNQEPSSTETVRVRSEPQEGDGDGNGPCWNIPVRGSGVSKVRTDFGANS